MMPSGPTTFYSERIGMLESRLAKVTSSRNRMALLRLLIFLTGLVSVYLAAAIDQWFFLLTAGSAVFFLGLVSRYGGLVRRRQHILNLLSINRREVRALEGDLSAFNDGERYLQEDHPFAGDLDVFGRGSLFQFLNRTATAAGEEFLAASLASPLTHGEDIQQRQQAVEEMAGKMEWCQEFMATGHEVTEGRKSREDLLQWIGEPPSFGHPVYRVLIVIVPLLAAAVLTLVSLGYLPWVVLLLYLAVPFSIIGKKLPTLNRKHAILGNKSEIMNKYGRLLALLEEQEFRSARLASLRKKLGNEKETPARAIRELSNIMRSFDNRLNMIAGFLLNAVFIWDIRQVIRLEKWQAKHKDELPAWFDVLAETDALCSFGVFRFNHPGSVFPGLSTDGELVRGREVHHPLIPAASSVPNDIDCPGWQHITIITGANMAGKSTYLRLVGTNLLLAMAGCPVKAREFTFTPVQLISGIRTRDSLLKRESYFYAELKRLKFIIDKLQQGDSLFVLLDEVLKGTNSKDKLSGSFALLRKLLNYQVSGMIATHDLALSEMEKEYPENIANRSFEVVIRDNRLEFDYLLKEGVAKMMNATFLMEKMGITDPSGSDRQ